MRTIILTIEKTGASLIGAVLNCSRGVKIISPSICTWLITESSSKIAHVNQIVQSSENELSNIHITPIKYWTYKSLDLNVLDRLNELHETFPDNKYIFLYRNPIISSCYYMDNYNLLAIDALSYWHDINCIFRYFSLSLDETQYIHVRFEDVILSSRGTFKKLFDLVECQYNDQFLSYADFDQPDMRWSDSLMRGRLIDDKIDDKPKTAYNGLAEAWLNFQSSDIVSLLRYSNCSAED